MNRILVTRCIVAAAGAMIPLGGCDSTPPQTVYLQANRIPQAPPPIVKEIPVPVPVPQWRRLPDTRPTASTQPTTRQIIEDATHAAIQKPSADGFIQAVQTYAYVPGDVYEVIASPGRVTTILLKPGEELLAQVAGDTAQWMVGDTHCGSGDSMQTLVLVKPLKPGLQTNLVLSTNQRIYSIDLESVAGVYHSAVQWTYPADFAQQLAAEQRRQSRDAEAVIAPVVKLSDLDFGYRIRPKGKRPDWTPLRVFTDGHKTYIAFPRNLDAHEAPPLFVLSAKGDAELVNYRQRANWYIVDRVINRAELRLGQSPQQIVSIERQ